MIEFNTYNKNGKGVLPPFSINTKIHDPAFYKPSDALINAVNVSIQLGKPLFLTGNPGTGKTQLAHHIAYFFHSDKNEEERLLVFNTRSTSAAKDLFYHYDSLKHFQYIQNQDKEELTNSIIEEKFIRYNALGEAIKKNERRIVLIDEIDKAPRDLPNDILNILDEMAFEVPEIDRIKKNRFSSKVENRPIVIITSNSERNMPDAFLRRCVYFHLDDPNDEELQEILISKLDIDRILINERILPHYRSIQEILTKKQPGTAELVYWAYLISKRPEIKISELPKSLEEVKDWSSKIGIEQLKSSYSLLVKHQEDMGRVMNKIKG